LITLNPVQAAGSGITIYFNDLSGAGASKANNDAGTGFAVGTPILQATLTSDVSNYTDTTKSLGLPVQPLNPLGTGYVGVTTDQGTGSTTLSAGVTSYNTAFFQNAPAIITTTFSSNLVNPYADIAASKQFTSINGATAITPHVGANNGTSGPDFLLEVSGATQAFQVAPEPGTISMALTGLGLASLAAWRKQRRRRA
jgi:hypothetical protein